MAYRDVLNFYQLLWLHVVTSVLCVAIAFPFVANGFNRFSVKEIVIGYHT